MKNQDGKQEYSTFVESGDDSFGEKSELAPFDTADPIKDIADNPESYEI